MERWRGKVAVVTGSSSGIGAAIVIDLLKAGMNVVGLARRKERTEELINQLGTTSKSYGKLYAIECDLTKEDNIVEAFKWIESNLGRVDVVVNNAGVARCTPTLEEGNEDVLKLVLQTNLWGLILCTKKAYEIMQRNDINDGHFFNINSVAGHNVINMGGAQLTNVYAPSKFAVKALTEVLRQEFVYSQTKYKVTNVSPGIVRTEMFNEEFQRVYPGSPALEPEDISGAVLHALGTPPHVQIQEIIIKPVGELF